jgi:hypothetical protein
MCKLCKTCKGVIITMTYMLAEPCRTRITLQNEQVMCKALNHWQTMILAELAELAQLNNNFLMIAKPRFNGFTFKHNRFMLSKLPCIG